VGLGAFREFGYQRCRDEYGRRRTCGCSVVIPDSVRNPADGGYRTFGEARDTPRRSANAVCEVFGNEYDKTMDVIAKAHVFGAPRLPALPCRAAHRLGQVRRRAWMDVRGR